MWHLPLLKTAPRTAVVFPGAGPARAVVFPGGPRAVVFPGVGTARAVVFPGRMGCGATGGGPAWP